MAWALAFLVTLSAAGAPLADADEAEAPQEDAATTITFEPTSGPVGSYVWVNGSGPLGDEAALGTLSLALERHAEDRLGFRVPQVDPGSYGLRVQTETGEAHACCFAVTEPATGDLPEDPARAPSDAEDCDLPKKNVQCNTFGTIKMDSQRHIRGEHIQAGAEIFLNTNFDEQDARSVLFSIRGVTEEGDAPIAIALERFETPAGDLLTVRVDDQKPNEINLWVDVLDTPVGTPISLEVKVAALDRGAFILETLVMAFDRGYEPIRTADDEEASLYSFTLLGVNEETGDLSSSGRGLGISTPGPGAALAVAATLGLLALLSRRRSR